jgi:hypothetical protein
MEVNRGLDMGVNHGSKRRDHHHHGPSLPMLALAVVGAAVFSAFLLGKFSFDGPGTSTSVPSPPFAASSERKHQELVLTVPQALQEARRRRSAGEMTSAAELLRAALRRAGVGTLPPLLSSSLGTTDENHDDAHPLRPYESVVHGMKRLPSADATTQAAEATEELAEIFAALRRHPASLEVEMKAHALRRHAADAFPAASQPVSLPYTQLRVVLSAVRLGTAFSKVRRYREGVEALRAIAPLDTSLGKTARSSYHMLSARLSECAGDFAAAILALEVCVLAGHIYARSQFVVHCPRVCFRRPKGSAEVCMIYACAGCRVHDT